MSLIERQRLVGMADRAAGGRGRHRAVGTRCSAAPRLETSVRRAKSKQDLLDPAQIGAKGTASAKFQVRPQHTDASVAFFAHGHSRYSGGRLRRYAFISGGMPANVACMVALQLFTSCAASTSRRNTQSRMWCVSHGAKHE